MKADQKLIDILCRMSDKELEAAIEFHKFHLDQLYIQKKVRREEHSK